MNADFTIRESMESSLEKAPEERPMLTLSELAYLAGTSPHLVEQLLEWDILIPSAKDPEPLFPADLLPQVCRIIRLHVGLGIDFPSMPLVLDLLDRIAGLEKRLADIESRR